MSKKEKLVDRFLLLPKNLTWEELVGVLSFYGCEELRTGKTGGSRRRFADANKNVLTLHKPHPANIVKQYVIRQVIEDLKEKGKIKDDYE